MKKLIHGYMLAAALFVCAVVTYFISASDPDNVYFEQTGILFRNAFFGALIIYLARKLELPQIKVRPMLEKGLKDKDGVGFGLALIALAIFYYGIYNLLGMILVRGL